MAGQFLLATWDRTPNGGVIHQRADANRAQDGRGQLRRRSWTRSDDVIGVELGPGMVRAARGEEVEYIRKVTLHRKVDEECWRVTCKAPIKLGWIDISKCDAQDPNYRSRFAAEGVNPYKRDEVFAAISPLEALEFAMPTAAIGNNGEMIMVNDVSRAFFHAKVKRDVYVALPDEGETIQDHGQFAG